MCWNINFTKIAGVGVNIGGTGLETGHMRKHAHGQSVQCPLDLQEKPRKNDQKDQGFLTLASSPAFWWVGGEDLGRGKAWYPLHVHGLVIVVVHVIIILVSGLSTGIQGLSIHPGGARGLSSTQVLHFRGSYMYLLYVKYA